MSRKSITRAMRQRREQLQFDRALRTASPAMQQELLAARAHQSLAR